MPTKQQKFKDGFGVFILSDKIIYDESGEPITFCQEYRRVADFIEEEVFNKFSRKCMDIERG